MRKLVEGKFLSALLRTTWATVCLEYKKLYMQDHPRSPGMYGLIMMVIKVESLALS